MARSACQLLAPRLQLLTPKVDTGVVSGLGGWSLGSFRFRELEFRVSGVRVSGLGFGFRGGVSSHSCSTRWSSCRVQGKARLAEVQEHPLEFGGSLGGL